MKRTATMRMELQQAYNSSVEKAKRVFLTVDTDVPDSVLPIHLKNTGDQTFEITPKAIQNLEFTDDYVEFTASFDSVVHNVSIPYDATICMIEEDIRNDLQ